MTPFDKFYAIESFSFKASDLPILSEHIFFYHEIAKLDPRFSSSIYNKLINIKILDQGNLYY